MKAVIKSRPSAAGAYSGRRSVFGVAGGPSTGVLAGRLTIPPRNPLQLPDPLLHLPPRLKRDDPLAGHVHRLAGAGVACPPGLALLDLEDAEVAEFDPALA